MSEKNIEPCPGMNCGCTDGVSHSPECMAETAATYAGGWFVKAGASPQPATLISAALIGLVRHVRAVPAYSKLLGDMESVEKAIALLAAPQTAPATLTGWKFSRRDEFVFDVLPPNGKPWVAYQNTPAGHLIEALVAQPAPATGDDLWLNIGKDGTIHAKSLSPVKGLDWQHYVRASAAHRREDQRDAEHADIGRLLHKAACELPDGWEIQLRVERGRRRRRRC